MPRRARSVPRACMCSNVSIYQYYTMALTFKVLKLWKGFLLQTLARPMLQNFFFFFFSSSLWTASLIERTSNRWSYWHWLKVFIEGICQKPLHFNSIVAGRTDLVRILNVQESQLARRHLKTMIFWPAFWFTMPQWLWSFQIDNLQFWTGEAPRFT